MIQPNDSYALLAHHAAMIAASGIAPEVAAARGYRSLTDPADAIALGFAEYQARVPALLVPVHGVGGGVALYQLRPDDPRKRRGKAIKYETIAGAGMVIDVPPAVLPAIGDPAAPLLITEGVKKADAAVSHGGNCIALLGVYNFRGTNDKGGRVALPDWESVALNGREVSVAYDSDLMSNPNVRGALERLTAFLQGRKAHVRHIHLPATDGGKCGLDDYLAAGHSIADVYALAREPDATPDTGQREWEPRLVNMGDVRPEPVAWLWPGRIALGKINLLDGDPGLGKSTITDDLAARVSTGATMPDGSSSDLSGPAGVVILSAEDGMADTIRPRLDAAGADVARIVALECMERGETERGVTLADIGAIETAIEAVNARLVIIDPMMAFMGGETNAHRDQDVRGILAPLARLAEHTGVAIVVVRHLNKGAQANVLYRGGGSIGIIGAVRVALMVGRDPEDPDGPRRILAVAKSNLAAFPPALAYHMEEAENGTARIVWEGATHHTAAAITATMPQDEGERSALDEAMDVLRLLLADGPMAAKVATSEMQSAGVAEKTIRRAREKLGIVPRREGGIGAAGAWMWELPHFSTTVHETPKMPTKPLTCPSQNNGHLREIMGILAHSAPDAPDADTWDTPDDAPIGDRVHLLFDGPEVAE